MELTIEEKTTIINQHIKNCMANAFNIQLTIIEEQSNGSPDQSLLTQLNEKLQYENNKQTALLAELASLSE